MNQTSQQSGCAPASRGQGQAIDLIEKIDLIGGPWQPRVVAEMNDYQFKVVKIAGDFIWHSHGDTDDTFIVLDGEMRIGVREPLVILPRSPYEPARWPSCQRASNTNPAR